MTTDDAGLAQHADEPSWAAALWRAGLIVARTAISVAICAGVYCLGAAWGLG